MIRSITIEPEPHLWVTLLNNINEGLLLGKNQSEWVELTRLEVLGSSYNTVLLTGHQAEVWHPGILSRYLTMETMADVISADAMIELVVDQDNNNPLSLHIPVSLNNDKQKRTFRKVKFSLARNHFSDLSGNNIPTGFRPPITDKELITDINPVIADYYQSETPPEYDSREIKIPADVSRSLSTVRSALIEESHRSSLAEQVAHAVAKIRGVKFDLPITPNRHLVTTTSLTRTSFWQALIQFAADNPEKLFETYNAAIQQLPDAGIVPLNRVGKRVEMPLWHIDETGNRRKAYHDDLSGDPTRLFPRALLTTGFVRLVLCDLMIHGTGGIRYDVITDMWLKNWLGDAVPAAFVCASATLVLDLSTNRVSLKQLRQAEQHARYMRFNLDRIVGNNAEITRKTLLLLQLENAPRKSPARREYYEQIQSLQRIWCNKYHNLIDKADAVVENLKLQLANYDVLEDRTWPFVFYGTHNLEELKKRIMSDFSTLPASRETADNIVIYSNKPQLADRTDNPAYYGTKPCRRNI